MIHILQRADIVTDPTPLAPPRARGAVSVVAKPGARGTALDDLYQSGSLKCLFPRTAATSLEAVLLNTAGGITGGDAFSVKAQALAGSELTLTTQAAERAYRAQTGKPGKLESHVKVGKGAQANWLPQETILFQGCALKRSLTVDLENDARLLLAEPVIFGRTAMGESLTDASINDRIEIRRNGVPVYLDALQLHGNIQAELDRPFVAGGAVAMASVIYVAPDAETYLARLREILPETGGASLIAPDILVLRLLAKDSFLLRQTLVPVLKCLLNTNLPRCWMT